MAPAQSAWTAQKARSSASSILRASSEDMAAIAGALGLAPRQYAILGFSSGAVHTLASLSNRPGDAAAYGMMSTDGPYWLMREEPAGSLGRTPVDAVPRSSRRIIARTAVARAYLVNDGTGVCAR